jgi:hypothetical protein
MLEIGPAFCYTRGTLIRISLTIRKSVMAASPILTLTLRARPPKSPAAGMKNRCAKIAGGNFAHLLFAGEIEGAHK